MSSDLKQYSVNQFDIDDLYAMKEENLFIPKVKIENYGEVYFTNDMDEQKILDDLHNEFFNFYLNIKFKYTNVNDIPADIVKEIKRIFPHNDVVNCANSIYKYRPNTAIVAIHLKSEEEQMEHIIDKIFQIQYCINAKDLFEEMFNYIHNKYFDCITSSKNNLIGVADEKLIGEIYLTYKVVYLENKAILARERYVESDIKF